MSPPVSDLDGDGIADAVDNCPSVPNADQADADGDSLGNACDSDANGDRIADALQPPGTPPGSFTDDTGDGDVTTGSVVDGSFSSIEDAPDPDGVRVTTGGTALRLEMSCASGGYTTEVAAGTSTVLTCGSLRVEHVTGGYVRVIPAGTTTAVTFAPNSSGTVHAEVGTVSVTGVSGDVTLSVDGVDVPLPEGDSALIQSGVGNNSITGTDGNDLIVDLGGNNAIDAKGGDDQIVVDGSGNNKVKGGEGNDTITTGAGNDTIDGGNGDDTILAGDGNNIVKGGTENDTITTGQGNDTIDGGTGTDTCDPGGGHNSVTNCSP